MRVTNQQIAKVLALNSPDIAGKVEEYTKAIEAMPEEQRLALKSAYIFSSKVPPEEREDMFQELTYRVLKAFHQQQAEIRNKEAFAYRVAQNYWHTWWRDYKRHQPHLAGSLNEVIEVDEDGNGVEVIDTIVGEDDLEGKVIDKLETQRLRDKLRDMPDTIKPIIKKRLKGEKLSPTERSSLFRYHQKLLH